MARACEFLDGIKNLGYRKAYEGGLSFNLDDIIIPEEKKALVERGNEEVRQITENYNMGFITDTERYNQVIDTWTHVNNDLGNVLMKEMTEADQGFNAVFMMLDSGARGSKDQIRQLSGMRGLMAKPQKAGAEGAQIIENPILSNFKEGMSLVVFPEGARTFTGHMGTFRRGAFMLADELQLPVVPLTINGSFNVMPRMRDLHFVVWHPLKLTIHEPIEPQGKSRENILRMEKLSYEAVMSGLVPEYQGYIENPDQ